MLDTPDKNSNEYLRAEDNLVVNVAASLDKFASSYSPIIWLARKILAKMGIQFSTVNRVFSYEHHVRNFSSLSIGRKITVIVEILSIPLIALLVHRLLPT